MLEEQKKLLLSQASAETTLKVLDAHVAPVNSARKTYKEAFAQRVSSKIKPAVITDPGSSSKPRITTEFKFVTKLNPRDSPYWKGRLRCCSSRPPQA
jgi:hypothetical protein